MTILMNWLAEAVGATNDNSIMDIEENCGSIWITLEDGTTKSLMVIDCEPEEDEQEIQH